ncbi:MAG: PAS domain S-box protein [Immundisolibacteraceae bacterium]|nr:PAS domain S-box protein [Immundisolibacteraceae bacterium]
MKSMQAAPSVDGYLKTAQTGDRSPKKRIVAIRARHCPEPSAGWFPPSELCQLEIHDDLLVCYQKLHGQQPPDLLVITVGSQIAETADFVNKLRMDSYLVDLTVLMLAEESQLIDMMPQFSGMKNLDFAAPASSPEMLQRRINHLLSLSDIERKEAPVPVHLQVVDNVMSRLINGRRRSEMESRLFKQVLDEALDAALMFDSASFECVYANKSALKMWGITDSSRPVSQLLELWPTDQLAIIKDQIDRLVSGQDAVIQAELLQHKVDGQEFPVRLRLRLVSDGQDAGRVVAKIDDISEQIRQRSEVEYRALHD